MTKPLQVQIVTLLGGLGGAYQAWNRETSLGWKIATALIYGVVSGLWWYYLVGPSGPPRFRKSRRDSDDDEC